MTPSLRHCLHCHACGVHLCQVQMTWDFLPQRSLQNPKKHANNTSKPHEAAKITVISLIHVLVCDNKTCFILVAGIVWEHLFLNRYHMFRHSQHLGSCQNLVHQIIVLRIRLRLFKRWIVLAIHWINYHPVDNAIGLY